MASPDEPALAKEATKAEDPAQGSTVIEVMPNNSIDEAIRASAVVVFGKTHCPFCLEVKRTFEQDLHVPFTLYNLDKVPDGAKVHAELKAKYKQSTVPYVFIGGNLLGGCDDTKAAQHDGRLIKLLVAAGVSPQAGHGSGGGALLEGAAPALTTLFSFPEVVDDRVARFNGIFGFIVCLLVACFNWMTQAHWVMGGLMVDFILRFLGGSNISPIGSLSNLCVAIMDATGSKPKWVAGQSKQFASLCGVMFSALAFLFYLCSVHEDKLTNVGLAFTCALGGATFLEGFLGFCLGCWMFSLATQFGLLPKETFLIYTNVRDEANYTWEDMNKVLGEGTPAAHRRSLHPDGKTPTQIDYKYKAKSDDFTREDFHLVKHVKITHFFMPMGVAGLACAWKAASTWENIYVTANVYRPHALAAALIFVILLCLYALKAWTYPHKVHKEWMHPVAGNAFVVPLVTTVLFAFLVSGDSLTFAKVLFWIGAPASLLMSLVRVGDWIAQRKDLEHLNAAWMIMPVANAVAALVGPTLTPKYQDASQFWFAVAFMMWLLLFAATFYRAIIHTDEDDRVRPLLAVWVAAPAVLGVAYVSAFPSTVALGVYNDFIFINFTWFSVTLALIFMWMFVRPYFGRIRFDFSYWAAGFPSAALALICLTYYQVKPGGLSRGIAITALAASCYLHAVLLLQTAAAILRKRVFVPDYKWGPLSFMRLTHEALRGATAHILALAEVAASSSGVSADLVASLDREWQLLSLMHDEHSKHEDQVIFKLYDEYYPGLVKPFNDEHEQHHAAMSQVAQQLAALKTNPSPAAAQALLAGLKAYAGQLEQHLRAEEDHLIGMPRKHIPLALHKDTMRKCWAATPALVWYELLPAILNSLPMLHQRVRFMKTLLWVQPERAQHMGMMVGLGVDVVQWRRITDELPELIPRGARGWARYY